MNKYRQVKAIIDEENEEEINEEDKDKSKDKDKDSKDSQNFFFYGRRFRIK